MENLIKEIQELQLIREDQTKKIENLKAAMAEVDSKLEEKKAELLKKMDESVCKEYDVEDLNATVFERENVGYKDENKVLAYLKENYPQFVKTKVTESIDKTPLKKQIKADYVLAEALDSMTETTVTRYVVVTTAQNHERMLEHINNGK